MGHIISKKGVAADESKVAAMLDWSRPKSLKELRGFLGLTGYYRRFVEAYEKIAWPLTPQLKKDSFGWNEAAEAAFTKLKMALTTVPILALPNFSQPFVIETDASGHGLRGCINAKSEAHCLLQSGSSTEKPEYIHI